MKEVGLPQTCMRGHRPKERMSAVMGKSGELLQFSTQRPFQTLASPLAMGKVYLARATVPLLHLHPCFDMPLATNSSNMVSAPQRPMDSDHNSVSPTLNRKSSPGQKVHGDQANFVLLDQAVIFKDQAETGVGNELQLKRTWDITNPLNLVMMETQVALKSFTTHAMWLIVQAILSLSIGPSLEALTLMENNAVANTTEGIKENKVGQKKQMTRLEKMEHGYATNQMTTLIFLCLTDLVYILSTVLLAKSAQHSHISMPACRQVFLGGAAHTAARSGMDSNCTMTREKGMTLQNQNTVCVTEVAV